LYSTIVTTPLNNATPWAVTFRRTKKSSMCSITACIDDQDAGFCNVVSIYWWRYAMIGRGEIGQHVLTRRLVPLRLNFLFFIFVIFFYSLLYFSLHIWIVYPSGYCFSHNHNPFPPSWDGNSNSMVAILMLFFFFFFFFKKVKKLKIKISYSKAVQN